ncbi:MAG: acyl-CoA dehydrogenase, partial [Deltaproteobacteria bacterium]|nr:acyl-CoA dehydrogenase [Deltaproteobacteria bacterium]
ACANEKFTYISERAVQIHGGIGTTREADIALFYRRAKTYDTSCGDTSYHYENVAEKLLTQGL